MGLLAVGLGSTNWTTAAKNAAGAARDSVPAGNTFRFQAPRAEEINLGDVQEVPLVGFRGGDLVFQPLLDQGAMELALDGSKSGL